MKHNSPYRLYNSMIYKPRNVHYARYEIPTIRLRRGLYEPVSHQHRRVSKSFQRYIQRKQCSSSWKTSYSSSSNRQINRRREFPNSSQKRCHHTFQCSSWYCCSQLHYTHHGRATFHSTARVGIKIRKCACFLTLI